MNAELPPTLVDTLTDFAIDLPDEQIELLDRYREALWRWNQQLNLTRHTTIKKFVGRDVVDSLQSRLGRERYQQLTLEGSEMPVTDIVEQNRTVLLA